jgi:sugar/nucleoside kinase (ribokinase family)
LIERAPRRKGPAILCAGISVQDIVMRVKAFPAAGTKVSASDFIITGGGCAANAAVTAARLGAQVSFAGPLGDEADATSNRIVADLVADGIDCSGATRVAGGTASVSLILLDALGEKTIATRRGSKLNSAVPADAEQLVATVDAVLVDNRFDDYVTPICRAASKRRIPIVIDLDAPTRVKDPLLALGTHVIASTEALRATTRLEDHAAALVMLGKQLAGFVAVTDGPQGVYWLEDGAMQHMPAFDIDAIDTLGAGDAFHGAFTVALAENRTIPECLRFASATAALKCTRFGGTSGAPKRARVEEFLKQQALG